MLYLKLLKEFLTAVVNFTNILVKAFMGADPNSAINTVKPLVFFWAFGIFACKNCK